MNVPGGYLEMRIALQWVTIGECPLRPCDAVRKVYDDYDGLEHLFCTSGGLSHRIRPDVWAMVKRL